MQDFLLLAVAAPAPGGTGTFVKGLAVFIAFVVIFVGSVWLLTSMILGARLGYFVTGACLFAVTFMISTIWFVTKLGPKGEQGFLGDLGLETGWIAIGAGPKLSSVGAPQGRWNIADFPNGKGWVVPKSRRYLADLKGPDSTATELANVKPIMDTLITEAVSPVPGIRDRVKGQVRGQVGLDPSAFLTTDIKMKQVKVEKKDSVIAVGRAVPTAKLTAGALGSAPDGTVSRFLVKPGTDVIPGQPVMEVKAGSQVVQLTADKPGKLLRFEFKTGDKIKPNVAFATVDITGQPGVPQPVEVAAIRVRGSVRIPAFIYLVGSLVLMVLHLIGVSKTEKAARLTQPQIA